jgi:hypothetical protein
MQTQFIPPNLREFDDAAANATPISAPLKPHRSHRPAVEWHKPKRKRGRGDGKDWRRTRLEWRSIDKEWRIFQQRWLKPSKKPGKKPLAIIRTVQFK